MKSEPTILPGVILSDRVIEDRMTGQRSLIGIIDRFNLPRLPATVMPFWATCWVTNLHGDIGQIEGACRIEHPNSGHVIDSTGVQISVKGSLERDDVIAMPMPLDGATFKHEGTYSVVMLISGEEVGRRNFQVALRKSPPQS